VHIIDFFKRCNDDNWFSHEICDLEDISSDHVKEIPRSGYLHSQVRISMNAVSPLHPAKQ
jgi:hypothetical protein